MKVLFISFVVGLGVGILYGLIRVKSPAPPIVALLGLLGMVIGEQFGIWLQTKKLDVSHAASVRKRPNFPVAAICKSGRDE
jgi:XapX domain-containing protein